MVDLVTGVCECAINSDNPPPYESPLGEVGDEGTDKRRGRSFTHFLGFVCVTTALLAVLACCRRRRQVTAFAVSPAHPVDATMMVAPSRVPVMAQPVQSARVDVTALPANEVSAVFDPPMTREAQEKCDRELAHRIAMNEYSQ
jgi:hypothetical protein